jgi:DtxR family Mn-dependent transcriptional regulator
MYSPAEENYLKAMFSLANAKGEISVNDLSKRLDIKMPTVNSMMKRLLEKKLVHYVSYKPIKLTASGKKEAGLIVRKHRLTEMYLSQKMGFGWEQVHEIAEQIEHIQSPLFFEKMDELLGYPKFDPHGSPIPDKNGAIEIPDYISLAKCEVNDTVKLKAIAESSEEFLKYLNQRSILLGTVIEIKEIETFDKSMHVRYGKGKNVVLSQFVCERLLVESIEGGS